MSLHTDDRGTPGETANLPAIRMSFSSEIPNGGWVVCDIRDSGCLGSLSLDRALVTLGRDSVLRRRYLRRRWQGRNASGRSPSRERLHAAAK